MINNTDIHSQNTSSKQLLQRGQELQKKGDLAQASKFYSQAVTLEPQNAQIHYKLGKCLALQKQFEHSESAYRQAIELDSQNSLFYHSFGDLKFEQKKWNEARDLYRTALKHNKHFAWSHYNLGRALQNLGQTAKAIESFKQAIKLKPKLDKFYISLIKLFDDKKNPSEIVQYYQQLAALKFEQKQLDEAIQLYQKTTELVELYSKQLKAKDTWISLHRKSTLKDFSQELKRIKSEDIDGIIEYNNYQLFDFSEIHNLSKLSQEFSSSALEILKENLTDWATREDEEQRFKEFADKKQVSFISPYTGKTVYTCKSILINLRCIAYIFTCKKSIFYWIRNNASHGEFIYIPEIEAITFKHRKFSNEEVVSIINNLKKYILKNQEEFCTYIESKSETKSYAYINQARPFHYLFDRLGGLIYLESCGLLDKIDGFIHNRSTNYFELTKLLPKISAKELIRIKGSEKGKELVDLQKLIYKNNGFVYFIRQLKLKNINPQYFLAAAESSRQEIETLASFIVRKPKFTLNTGESVVDLIENHHPLVWFGIAIEKRYWIEQVEGISSIIGELINEFPNIGIIIDGMTGNDNQIFDIGNYQQLYEKENQILSEIIMNIPEGIGVYSTIGMNARHKLFIAKRIDFFITQLGTQSLLPSFMAKKPGILHALPSFPGECLYDPNTAIMIDKKHVTPRRSTEILLKQREGSNIEFQSYSLDWQIIYKSIKEQILPNLK